MHRMVAQAVVLSPVGVVPALITHNTFLALLTASVDAQKDGRLST